MPNRRDKLQAIIQRDLADILAFEIKNKTVGFPCLNEVHLTADYSLAKCYVSFLGSKHPKENFEELCKLRGVIRSLLAKKLDIYKVPDLQFIYDDSFDKAERIEKIIEEEGKEIASFHQEENED